MKSPLTVMPFMLVIILLKPESLPGGQEGFASGSGLGLDRFFPKRIPTVGLEIITVRVRVMGRVRVRVRARAGVRVRVTMSFIRVRVRVRVRAVCRVRKGCLYESQLVRLFVGIGTLYG